MQSPPHSARSMSTSGVFVSVAASSIPMRTSRWTYWPSLYHSKGDMGMLCLLWSSAIEHSFMHTSIYSHVHTYRKSQVAHTIRLATPYKMSNICNNCFNKSTDIVYP